jgi:hypothetical protein
VKSDWFWQTLTLENQPWFFKMCLFQMQPAALHRGRGQASGRDVEMDPVAEVELKAQVVGLYNLNAVYS